MASLVVVGWTNREIGERLFQRRGIPVLEARTAAEALDALREMTAQLAGWRRPDP